ncbi:MAG: LEPR-XLL domain-containing protein [Kiritimatiellia bacterium]
MGKHTTSSDFDLEALEARVLLSADGLAAGVSPSANAHNQEEVAPAQGIVAATPAAQTEDLFGGMQDQSLNADASGAVAPADEAAPAEAVLNNGESASEISSSNPAAQFLAPAVEIDGLHPSETDSATPVSTMEATAAVEVPALAEELVATELAPTGPPENLLISPAVLPEHKELTDWLGTLASAQSSFVFKLEDADSLVVDASGQIDIWNLEPEQLFSLGIRELTINGLDATDDTLLADLGRGDLPLGVTFNGGAGGYDTLVVRGVDGGSYTPGAVFGDGVVTAGASVISFTGLEPVVIDGSSVTGTAPGGSDVSALPATFTFTTPGGADNLTIDSPAAGRNRISGTSGGVAFESITFTNIATLVIDTGANDASGDEDDIVLVSGNVVAAGLTQINLMLGSGDDRVDLSAMGTLGAVLVSIDGGAGTDELVGVNSDSVWTLTGVNEGDLNSAVSFTAVDTLTGGSGKDTFKFSGGSVTGDMTGGAGLEEIQIRDFLVIGGDMNFNGLAESVTLDNGTVVPAWVTKFSVTSGTLFAGTGYGTADEQGFTATSVNLSLAVITDPALGRTWYAASGTAGGITVGGFGGVTISVTNLAVQVNTAVGGRVVDFNDGTGPNLLAMAVPGGSDIEFEGADGEQVAVSGTVTVTIPGFVDLTGGFSFRKADGSFTLSDGTALTSIPYLSVGGTVTTASVTAGGVALKLDNLEVGLLLVRGAGVTYTAIKAKVGSASITGISGLGLTVNDFNLVINKTSDDSGRGGARSGCGGEPGGRAGGGLDRSVHPGRDPGHGRGCGDPSGGQRGD